MFPALMTFATSNAPSSRRAPVVSSDAEREARELRPVVRGVVAHVLGERSDSADVEECTQEAMRRAFEGRDRVRDGQALGAWAAGIARHVALDEIRSRRRARARNVDSQNPTSGVGEVDPVANVADTSPDPFELISRGDRDRKIHEAMAKLPEKQREALTMFHVEGLDYKAIAARLGVPLGTVATWVLRGRRAMAEGLQLEET